MTDRLDDFVRGALPDVTINDERIERLVARTLHQLPPRKSGWREKLLAWVQFAPSPVMSYGIPVVFATWMGLVVGGWIGTDIPNTDTSWSTLLHPTSVTAYWE